eukprot:763295-Hanusia_phi.AAC.2
MVDHREVLTDMDMNEAAKLAEEERRGWRRRGRRRRYSSQDDILSFYIYLRDYLPISCALVKTPEPVPFPLLTNTIVSLYPRLHNSNLETTQTYRLTCRRRDLLQLETEVSALQEELLVDSSCNGGPAFEVEDTIDCPERDRVRSRISSNSTHIRRCADGMASSPP